MDYQNDFCRASTWQATIPSLTRKLTEKWPDPADTSVVNCQEASKKLTIEALFVVCIILFFVMLNFIGSSINAYESFCEAFSRKGKDENKDTQAEGKMKSTESSKSLVWRENCRKFFDCFCVQANGRKILCGASKQDHLDCIDGIRAFFFLVILVSHFTVFYVSSFKNMEKNFHYIFEKPFTHILTTSNFGIDAFIVLSGFLLGYFFSNYYEENNGKIPWVAFYASKFLRITPVYMILLGFYSTLFTYMSSSPIWPTYDTNPICKEKWMWHLLYINNFDTHYNQCMNMTWFLACLMQLHVISPLFMVPLKRCPRIGYVLSLIAICTSSVASFVTAKKYNLYAIFPKIELQSGGYDELFRRLWQFTDEFHQNTYLRFTPYLIGILLGCYLNKRKLTKKNNLLKLYFGWILFCAVLVYFSLFVLRNKEESAFEAAVYHGLKSLMFSCCFSWILFVCLTGQGGLISKFLSHQVFKIFSRLSLCGYLTQSIVLEGYFLSVEIFTDESFTQSGLLDSVWITHFIRVFLYTMVSAFVASLLFEYPLKRLLYVYLPAK